MDLQLVGNRRVNGKKRTTSGCQSQTYAQVVGLKGKYMTGAGIARAEPAHNQ